ncbi:DUF6542 domain-containing protein [Lentzea sp. NBRC 105346]|uniref:DUF6542 domain-containing protein n=1 Tax=Lentzea sp. NBRC 105346 TaxID=3032205 RepID=UPI002557A19E|nr:DUF6542 domain-containing protein [Lentzea sp. NBRC 105346]
MSELRDRRVALDDDDDFEGQDIPAWNYRAIAGTFKGIPWWASILCALVPAVIGAYIDISSGKTVGWVFNILFFVGAIAGICLVQRRSLFAPMVQPPLILAATVPTLVLLTGGVPKAALAAMALGLGKPLIDSFPVMAVTTLFTVGIGIARMLSQKDPNRPSKADVREAKADLKRRPKPSSEPRRRPAQDEGERPRRPRPDAARRESTARRPAPQGERRPRPAQGERAPQRRPRPPRDDR